MKSLIKRRRLRIAIAVATAILSAASAAVFIAQPAYAASQTLYPTGCHQKVYASWDLTAGQATTMSSGR